MWISRCFVVALKQTEHWQWSLDSKSMAAYRDHSDGDGRFDIPEPWQGSRRSQLQQIVVLFIRRTNSFVMLLAPPGGLK